MKELAGKTGVLVGLDLPSAGGGTEVAVWSPHQAIVWVKGETFKAEGETADLWSLIGMTQKDKYCMIPLTWGT